MSDHIDDSTTDEEIEATVMRDKLRAVASPQATRPDAEMQTRILDAAYAQQKRMESAAQPAAGTTPHIHECDHETEGEHVCRCVICGKHIGTPPSEGTTPQAERPTDSDWVWWFDREPEDRLRMIRQIRSGQSVEYRPFTSDIENLRPPRTVAPVETRLTAEQFCPIAKNTSPHFAPTCLFCCMAEAFRDKSEATLIDQLPPTFYADRPLLFRVQQLVRIWQNAVTSNLKLESENTGLQEENERLKREGKQ